MMHCESCKYLVDECNMFTWIACSSNPNSTKIVMLKICGWCYERLE